MERIHLKTLQLNIPLWIIAANTSHNHRLAITSYIFAGLFFVAALVCSYRIASSNIKNKHAEPTP